MSILLLKRLSKGTLLGTQTKLLRNSIGLRE